MQDLQAILCGWPGLVALWRHGRLRGLLAAAGFAVLLNGAIIATWVQPSGVSLPLRWALWATVLLTWSLSRRRSRALLRQPLAGQPGDVGEGLFLQAQAEYLKGHWYEAEKQLTDYLKKHPDDADARLLLLGLLRRTARPAEARKQLRRLTSCAGCEKWEFELDRERQLLDRPASEPQDEPSTIPLAGGQPQGRSVSTAHESEGSHPAKRAA